MKRNLLSIAFIAISTLMITAIANDTKENKNCEGKMMGKHHKMEKGQRHAHQLFNPFEGITLSDEQKEQLKDLKAERKKEFEKKNKERKEKAEAYHKKGRDARKKYLDDMKKILTPDQYVKYLENMALNRPMMHKKSFAKRGHNGKRHNHPGFRPDGKLTPKAEPQESAQ